jgi:hypothetical protein
MRKNVKRLLAVMVLSVFCLAQVGFACETVATPKVSNANWDTPVQPFSTYYVGGHFYHDNGNGTCYEVIPKTVGEVPTYHYYYGR